MSYLVVVVLSLLWLVFFGPGLLQARRTSSPWASATTFQQSLTRISTGRAVTPDQQQIRRPTRRSRRAIARRRDVLSALTAAVIASVAAGVALGGFARWLVVPAMAALIGYVALLRARVVQSHAPRPIAVPFADPPALRGQDEVVPSVRRRTPEGSFERIAG